MKITIPQGLSSIPNSQESRTARFVADLLKEIGLYRVTEKTGGHGVVGVLENGHGPQVLHRADMDALPVPEPTGLEYASKRRVLILSATRFLSCMPVGLVSLLARSATS